MQDGQLGASLIESGVAQQLRSSAAAYRAQGNVLLANQLDSWAGQLENDPVSAYQQPYYRNPYPRRYGYPYDPFSYYSVFHPIDSFFPFSSRNITVTSTSTPGRVTNIR